MNGVSLTTNRIETCNLLIARRWKFAVALAAVAAVWPSAARADLIQVTTTGEIDDFCDDDGDWDGHQLAGTAAGDMFEIQYLYDDTTMNSSMTPGVGIYEGAIQSVNVKITHADDSSVTEFTYHTFSENEIQVLDDTGPGGTDQFGINVQGTNSDFLSTVFLLNDAGSTVFESSSLSAATSGLDLAGFSFFDVTFFPNSENDSEGDRILATIQTLDAVVVPAPGAALLGALGLMIVGRVRRRLS